MNKAHFEISVLSKTIHVDIFPAGKDCNVLISGGNRPHIGSVSVAWHDGDGQVVLQKIVLPSHKDDYVGDLYAQELARLTGCTVSVACGIHYDDISKAEIGQILSAMQQLLQEIAQRFSS